MTATLPAAHRLIEIDDDPYIRAIEVFETTPGCDRPKPTYPYLSPSQFKQYHRCQAAYWFKYGDHLREPQNSKLTFGTGWHVANHVFFHDPSGSIEDRAQRALLAGNAVMRTCGTQIWQPTYSKSKALDTPDSLEADLEKAITLSLPFWLAFKPVAIEQGYTIHWHGSRRALPLHGFTDLVDETAPGEWHSVIDLKSGAAKNPNHVAYDVAMNFYTAARDRIGEVPIKRRGYLVYKKNAERSVELVWGPDYTDRPPVGRLYAICVALTEALERGIYAAIPDMQICTGCAFREPCDEAFGP